MKVIIESAGEMRRTNIGECMINDTKFIQYPSGKYFVRYHYEDFLKRLAEDMHKNIANDFDNVVVVQGGEGSGKSNFCYQLAKAFDPAFDVEDGYVYDMESLKERFKRGDYGRSIFWMDEASNIANNREWNTQSNKDIVSILETMRSRHITFIMTIPHVERLDLYIRSFRMRYLITCAPMSFSNQGDKARGYFELKKRNSGGSMELIGYGSYDKIPDEDKERYEGLKLAFQEKKIEEITRDTSPGSKYKEKYESEREKFGKILLELHKSGMDSKEIMRIMGYKNRSTYDNALCAARKRFLEADE